MGERFRQLQVAWPQLVVLGAVLWLLVGAVVSWQLSVNYILRPATAVTGKVVAIEPDALYAPIPHGRPDCSLRPCLALTFDDGPNPQTTPQILDILEQEQVRATFFVVGSRVPGEESILRRMHHNGHEIGNHSWSHPNFTKLSSEQIVEQVNRTQQAIVAAGVPAPHLFRPPYGAVNPRVQNSVQLSIALWNVDPVDWESTSSAHLTQAIIDQAKPGGVLDLHDIYPGTVASLRPAIQALKGQYQFVTFSEMLALSPGQPGIYYGR